MQHANFSGAGVHERPQCMTGSPSDDLSHGGLLPLPRKVPVKGLNPLGGHFGTCYSELSNSVPLHELLPARHWLPGSHVGHAAEHDTETCTPATPDYCEGLGGGILLSPVLIEAGMDGSAFLMPGMVADLNMGSSRKRFWSTALRAVPAICRLGCTAKLFRQKLWTALVKTGLCVMFACRRLSRALCSCPPPSSGSWAAVKQERDIILRSSSLATIQYFMMGQLRVLMACFCASRCHPAICYGKCSGE